MEIVFKDNAWILCTFQGSLHNLSLDICSKLTSFDLRAQEGHLVCLDGPVSDNWLPISSGFGHPQHLMGPYLGLHESLGNGGLANVHNFVKFC